MSILAALVANWRFALYGLLAAGLLIGGWTINGWRHDAGRLKDAQAALQTEQKAKMAAQRAAIKADEERVTMGMALSEAEAQLLTTSNQAKRIVRVHVTKDPRCDLEASVIRVLSAAREGKAVDE